MENKNAEPTLENPKGTTDHTESVDTEAKLRAAAAAASEAQLEIDALKEEVEELRSLVAALQNKAPKEKYLKSYQVGDFVQVIGGVLTEWENGKVIETLAGRIEVGTAKGPVYIGSSANIKPQE